MKEYTVRFEGAVVGTRKSDRTYTHAIVVRIKGEHAWWASHPGVGGKPYVIGFAGSRQLAGKAVTVAWNKRIYTEVHAIEVEVREIAHKPADYRVAFWLRGSKRLSPGYTYVTKKNALRAARTYDGTVIPVVFEANHNPFRAVNPNAQEGN